MQQLHSFMQACGSGWNMAQTHSERIMVAVTASDTCTLLRAGCALLHRKSRGSVSWGQPAASGCITCARGATAGASATRFWALLLRFFDTDSAPLTRACAPSPAFKPCFIGCDPHCLSLMKSPTTCDLLYTDLGRWYWGAWAAAVKALAWPGMRDLRRPPHHVRRRTPPASPPGDNPNAGLPDAHSLLATGSAVAEGGKAVGSITGAALRMWWLNCVYRRCACRPAAVVARSGSRAESSLNLAAQASARNLQRAARWRRHVCLLVPCDTSC